MGLDLYARIEPLIPFHDEMQKLYTAFIRKLEKSNPETILDIGCGGGNFMKLAIDKGFKNIEGIDLSPAQVETAKKAGLKAEAIDIKEVTKTYDACVAVFDVLNYIPYDELEDFLKEVKRVLKPGGKFYADINSLYGFEEVAQGALLLEGEDTHGSLEAYFNDDRLVTSVRLFTKTGELYKKEEDVITQYYHSIEYIRKINPFGNMKVDNLTLYSKKPDKFLLTFFD